MPTYLMPVTHREGSESIESARKYSERPRSTGKCQNIETSEENDVQKSARKYRKVPESTGK